MSEETKKHRSDALASGMMIGYGIGLFTNVAILLMLKGALTGLEFLFPIEIFNGMITIVIAMGIISFVMGIIYEIYKRRKL